MIVKLLTEHHLEFLSLRGVSASHVLTKYETPFITRSRHSRIIPGDVVLVTYDCA